MNNIATLKLNCTMPAVIFNHKTYKFKSVADAIAVLTDINIKYNIEY